jgi:uncharacterized protein (TIGR02391 family)
MTARKQVSLASIPSALTKLERRLNGLPDAVDPSDRDNTVRRVVADVNATIDEVFGPESADAADFRITARGFYSYATDAYEREQAYRRGFRRAADALKAAIRRLKEWQDDAEGDSGSRVLRAYEGLELHPEIARAATDLYRNGHCANAIEDAVKALNDLVRLRSGENQDGTKLMEYVFAPQDPLLAFNGLADESDRDEQKGYMMMFSGAVAGLRNPRAHKIIEDDPERALEFIAYLSLLAKLLDGATKRNKARPTRSKNTD